MLSQQKSIHSKAATRRILKAIRNLRAIDFGRTDLSGELHNHRGFKMLSWLRVEKYTGVHSAFRQYYQQ
jgi:hypothetical protein